jgi:ketohexokinase
MARILLVGVATVDIINRVSGFPPEDSEVRALSHEVSRGGNAANTAVVLARLGHRAAFAGVLAADYAADLIRRDLGAHGVDTRHCRVFAEGRTPTSCVTLNAVNGSRTIVHYRDLPEFGAASFVRMDLSGYDWVHFEGRDCKATAQMLEYAGGFAGLGTSLEVEKPRPGMEHCIERAGLLLCARRYVESCGYETAGDFINATVDPAKPVVCAWGELGAFARVPGQQPTAVPAFEPAQVRDTLGAGDVFNAAVIHRVVAGLGLERAVRDGCLLAGRKCGVQGIDRIPLEGF